MILFLGTGSEMGSVGVARKKRVGGSVGSTVVTESYLTRQAVSRPRHVQQWALLLRSTSRSGSGSSNGSDGVVTEIW